MDIYMGRQPIFNKHCKVIGYELLYRDAAHQNEAHITNPDLATARVLSDAITVFGLTNLTDDKMAFVNFTENLILNDFVLLAKPNNIIVELLETIRVTDGLLQKLRMLKKKGYHIALDDYTGQPRLEPLLPLVDVVKVDFQQTRAIQQREIADRLTAMNRHVTLLAEKIECSAQFEWAKQQGYRMFQGYFFAKPTTVNKTIAGTGTALMRLMAELNHTELDYARCAEAIQSDSTLTYRFLEYMRGLAFFRGSLAASIQHNLVLVGAEELRRWTVLALAYDNNVTSTGEFVRLAYLRGAFASRLMRYGPHRHDASWGLLMGIFSLMDQILNIDMRELLHKVAMPQDIAQALLLEEDNYYAKLMQYILAYEFPWRNLVLPDLQMRLTDREVARIYMDSIVETDRIFKLMEGALS